MSYLQNGTLSQLQGVPVENRRNELLEFIKDVHSTSSPSSLSTSSSLKRFLKISNRPLVIPRNSATSFYEAELSSTKFPSIFSRKKAPGSNPDRTLSFISNRDQSTSKGNQGTPLPIAQPTTHKLSKSFYWNRLFHRQKSQVEAPEQEALAGKETKEVQVLKLRQEKYNPEAHSTNVVEKPSLGTSQEQQLPIVPKPELSEPMKTDPPVATKSEVYPWKRWFNRKKKQPADEDKAPEQETIAGKETKEVPVLQLKQEQYNPEQENQSAMNCEESPSGASQEQQPIDPKPDLSESADTDRSPVTTESEVYRWKRWFNRHRRQHKNEAPEEVLVQKQNSPESASEFEGPGVSQEQQLPRHPEPERLKPKTPIKRVLLPVATESEVYWKRWLPRRKSQAKVEAPVQKTGDETEEVVEPMTQSASDIEEPSLGDPQSDRLEPKAPIKNNYTSVAVESENAVPNQQAFDATEPEDVESHHSEPERLRPKKEEKRLARNVSEGQFLSTFKRDHLSVAAEPESAPDTVEQEDSEPNQSASDDVNLPIDPEPERWKPKTREKRFARNVSEDQILSKFERDSEDMEANQPASNEINSNP